MYGTLMLLECKEKRIQSPIFAVSSSTCSWGAFFLGLVVCPIGISIWTDGAHTQEKMSNPRRKTLFSSYYLVWEPNRERKIFSEDKWGSMNEWGGRNCFGLLLDGKLLCTKEGRNSKQSHFLQLKKKVFWRWWKNKIRKVSPLFPGWEQKLCSQ